MNVIQIVINDKISDYTLCIGTNVPFIFIYYVIYINNIIQYLLNINMYNIYILYR